MDIGSENREKTVVIFNNLPIIKEIKFKIWGKKKRKQNDRSTSAQPITKRDFKILKTRFTTVNTANVDSLFQNMLLNRAE